MMNCFAAHGIPQQHYVQEEEEYADFLMDEFDAGMSLNVEQGSTLRAYLSRRLFCSPMRISKKFAGMFSSALSSFKM